MLEISKYFIILWQSAMDSTNTNISALDSISSVVSELTSDTLYLDPTKLQGVTDAINSLNDNPTDYTPYIIFVVGIFLAVIIKKIYTLSEIKRLEKIFYLWNENLITNLKKQSEAFNKKGIEMEDIDCVPSTTELFGLKTLSKVILEIKQEKYFHIFISNRYCSKKLMKLFYRTFKSYNLIIDSEELFMIARAEIASSFDKAMDSWNTNLKQYSITLNEIQKKLDGNTTAEQGLLSILIPHLKVYTELQNTSLRAKIQIPKKEMMAHIEALETDMLRISGNKLASKILDACDNMGYSNKLMLNSYGMASMVYKGLAEKYLETHYKLELYTKLWKKTKRLHSPLIKLYKPSDY